MSNWLGKIFGIGCNASKKIPQQNLQAKTAQKVATKIESKIEPAVTQQVAKPYSKTLGEQLSYGKWYYGIDTSAKPKVRKFSGGIEKRYPCKDGGEVIVDYVSRADNSSSLHITKTGNPKDINKGDWYRGFYSDSAVKHCKDRLGYDSTRKIKKKGARKQVLSTQNGRTTEEVHVPLKRWEISDDILGGGKRVNSEINSWNPKDFDRFVD